MFLAIVLIIVGIVLGLVGVALIVAGIYAKKFITGDETSIMILKIILIILGVIMIIFSVSVISKNVKKCSQKDINTKLQYEHIQENENAYLFMTNK